MDRIEHKVDLRLFAVETNLLEYVQNKKCFETPVSKEDVAYQCDVAYQ